MIKNKVLNKKYFYNLWNIEKIDNPCYNHSGRTHRKKEV